MKLFFNRLFIMTKRIIMQPFYSAMLIFLIFLTIYYINVPEKEKSMYIPIAILNNDTSEVSTEFTEKLISKNSIFTFYTVNSKEELFSDIVTKKANMGYIIPDDFFSSCTSIDTISNIQVLITSGTVLYSLANEELYNTFFEYSAPLLIKDQIVNFDEFKGTDVSQLYTDIDEFYAAYKKSNSIFSIEDMSNGNYTDITSSIKLELPIRKIAAFFILTASLMGIAAYLSDKENKLYMTLNTKQHISFRLIQILASILPIGFVSLICLALLHESAFMPLLIHIILYMIAVIIFSLIVGAIFKKSTSFYKVLPIYLILTAVLGGVFFDLAQFDNSFKIISMFFLPYYF